MELLQLIRYINPACPIMIFDVNGVSICAVASKADINTDLFDYEVLEISQGFYDVKYQKTALYIQIQK